MAQSLFQYGQIETTLVKAKEIRPFVERLITLARKGTLVSRQRIIAMLGDRSIISKDEQEKYDAMSGAQRHKVLMARSGRRHRAGKVPASYNKKTISFVARSVVHQLITDVAPKFADRPGGYTRIIRLSKRRVGDAGDLAILQLVGKEEETPKGVKKVVGQRRQKALDRVRFLEGKGTKRKARGPQKKGGESSAKPAKEDQGASDTAV
jgi:large subunit ribosomal protein L17